MIISIDLARPEPPYEQIRSAIAAAVRSRSIEPGTRLPTVRQLARDLHLAPATVGHAYRALERDGLVYGAGRRGTFVAEPAATGEPTLDQLAQEYVNRARQQGAEWSEVMRAVVDALANDRP